MKTSISICALLLFFNYLCAQVPLAHAHAHNDYRQKKPLLEALENGFTSIEIDVYSHKKRLVVSHLKWNLNRKPSLEELYLIPLQKRIAENGGTVYFGDSTPVILMIDLKQDKGELYQLLKDQLPLYLDLFERNRAGKKQWGPLKIILSGRPPLDRLLVDSPDFLAVDGYLDALRPELGKALRPRASASFKKHAKWHKKRGLSPADRQKLADLVKAAQNLGIKTRFWATPNDPRLWKILLDMGVDWINVDDLGGFKRFMED